MKATNIRVVDPAEAPARPSRPNLPQNLALGLATGLLLGVVFVIAGDHVNRSLKAPGETPYHLKVPELGVIPEKRPVAAHRLTPLRAGTDGHR